MTDRRFALFKITIAGTDRALAATDDAELVAVPTFTGVPEQLCASSSFLTALGS